MFKSFLIFLPSALSVILGEKLRKISNDHEMFQFFAEFI